MENRSEGWLIEIPGGARVPAWTGRIQRSQQPQQRDERKKIVGLKPFKPLPPGMITHPAATPDRYIAARRLRRLGDPRVEQRLRGERAPKFHNDPATPRTAEP